MGVVRNLKQLIIIIIAFGLLVGISVFAARYWPKRTRELAAEDIVIRALIDVKKDKVDDLSHLIQSKSLLWRVPERKREKYMHKITAIARHDWGLANISDDAIRQSVTALPNAPRNILGSLVRFSQGTDYSEDYSEWDKDQPIVVQYTIHGRKQISTVWRENGMWRINDMPLGASANILNYQSVSDAIDHNDALIEGPFCDSGNN